VHPLKNHPISSSSLNLLQAARPTKPHTQTHKVEQTATYKNNYKKTLRGKLKEQYYATKASHIAVKDQENKI